MNEIYLWTDDIDQSLFPTNESDPEAFFYSILSDKDRFSWIVDDYQSLINSFNNIELSSGISPYFIQIANQEVIAVAEYVAKGSPAAKAGVVRGDIITNINNTTLNLNNYTDLFYGDKLLLKFAEYSDGSLFPSDREVSITTEVIETNPVHYQRIINFEGSEIGYIVYTGFSSGNQDKWIDSLDAIFFEYKNMGIKDVIFDIRYNPGGSLAVVRHIASVLAPANIIDGNNVLINFEWNSTYQNYFLSEEGPSSGNLIATFEENPIVNLDLTDIYFLTSRHSASASELIITGLDPYMNVIHIGEATFGKCYGSYTINDTEDPPRHNWAIQPIVYKYKNALGYTDFDNGLSPDIEIRDNILEAKAFGDLTDPILARALEEISGVSPISKKALEHDVKYKALSDPIREKKNRAILER
jgi:C-terminal processing protease CtpA/Prc